jgi:hypothetical protein
MRKKNLYLIITIFLLAVFCIMALAFMGCHYTDLLNRKTPVQESLDEEKEFLEAEEERVKREAEQQAKEEEIKQAEAEESAYIAKKAAEEAASEEEEISLPDEPVTYTGNIENGYPIVATLIVDFKTTVVTGSLSCCGDGINTYVDATITDGKIKLDTLKITTNYSGVAGSKEVEGSKGVEMPINGTITGIITDNLSTFNGEMSSEEGAQKFTAFRK